LTAEEIGPPLRAYVVSQLLPEYRYSFVSRAFLREWMNAAPRPAPPPGRRFTDTVTYFNPDWLDYNFSFLDGFLTFCASKGIDVMIVEGQIRPSAVTPAIAALDDVVRARLLALRARHPRLHYVARGELYQFTSEDYEDLTHVVPEAARRYTATLASYLSRVDAEGAEQPPHTASPPSAD
jgi:hypothetical protein